jgi:hypothetical protein
MSCYCGTSRKTIRRRRKAIDGHLRNYWNCRTLISSGILWGRIRNPRGLFAMSLTVSGEHELEVPTRGLVHRLSLVLGALCAGTAASVAFAYGGMLASALVAGVVAAILSQGGRSERVVLSWTGAGDLQLTDRSGATRRLRPGRSTRMIGSVLVLDCRPDGEPRTLWITPLEASPVRFRALCRRLAGSDR